MRVCKGLSHVIPRWIEFKRITTILRNTVLTLIFLNSLALKLFASLRDFIGIGCNIRNS